MDFLQFIPSKTVADHVRNTGYQLTATDAAYIVDNSDFPLKEKLRAFREIIATMPDCKRHKSTLHTALSCLIKEQEMLLALFQENGNGAYSCQILVKDGTNCAIFKNSILSKLYNTIQYKEFFCLQDCFDAIRAFPKKYLDEDCKIGSIFHLDPIRITKYNTGIKSDDIRANFNHDLQLVSIRNEKVESSMEYKNALRTIWALRLKDTFPFPFTSGDLVYNCLKSDTLKLSRCYDRNVGVLEIRQTNGKNQYNLYRLEPLERVRMLSCQCNPALLLRYEPIHKNTLPAKYYLIVALSAYLKEEICLTQFLSVYNFYMSKYMSEDIPPEEVKELRKFGIKI